MCMHEKLLIDEEVLNKQGGSVCIGRGSGGGGGSAVGYIPGRKERVCNVNVFKNFDVGATLKGIHFGAPNGMGQACVWLQ